MSVEIKDKAAGRSLLRRIFRRGPWENLATVLIGAGVVMLMQPISIDLYGYSFITILTGTVMFMIVSKFPD
jgi:4-hydroxybenzoate polyprenyltransferase